MKQYRVLVACEFSGTVRDAFTALGCDAWSCDIVPTESPGNHFQCDVLDVLDQGWDLMIAHPPCTFLTNSAEWAYGPGPYHQKVKPETLVGEARVAARKEAIAFAKALWAAPIPRIALENPIGALTKELGKPQIIQPHQFGADASKSTCLWLKNLPKLIPTEMVPPRIVTDSCGKEWKRWANQTDSGQNRLSPSDSRSDARSKTYPGIAAEMATQWKFHMDLYEEPSENREEVEFEMTVPAHQPNFDYAARQLFGGDIDVSPRVTVTVKVQLTAAQRVRLKSITSADLSEIRNGVNPVTIYGVNQKE